MRKRVSLSRIKRFAFCSMQSHLHDVLRIPWLYKRADTMTHHAVRSSLRYYFGLEVKGTKAEHAALAMNRLDQKLMRIRHTWNLTPESELMRGEFNLALSALHKTYDATKDVMLGALVPVEFEYHKQVAGIDWTITHRLDAVFAKNRKVRGAMESYVFLNIDDPLDPLQRNAKYGDLTMAFLSYIARDQMKLETGLPIEVVDFPLVKRPKTQLLLRDGRKEFEAFLDNTLALMATECAIPVGDPVKCVHCPYSAVCKPSLAEITRSPFDKWKRKKLYLNLKQNADGMIVLRPSGD